MGTLDNSLKQRSDIHLIRKIWHFIGVIGLAVLYHQLSRSVAIQGLILISATAIFIDLLRLKVSPLNRIVLFLFGFLMRENERHSLAGSTHLLLGVLTLAFFFPPPIVLLSLLFLAVADPVASYFGIRFGKDRLWGSKSLQGSLAAFVVCTLLSFVFFMHQNIMTERILVVSILSGLSGSLAEALPIGKLDDNFLIPVASALFLSVIFYVFGGF